MKNKWLITGALSAGLMLTSAPAVWADAWTQNFSGDMAAGTGVVSGSTDIAQGSGTVVGTIIASEAVPAAKTGIDSDVVTGEVKDVTKDTGAWKDAAEGSGVVSVPGTQQDAGGFQRVEPLQNTSLLQNAEMAQSAGLAQNVGTEQQSAGLAQNAGTEQQSAGLAQNAGIQQQSAEPLQDAGPQGELSIDRTIGKNFIKQSFMECIGRSRSQVEEILGTSGEIEETEDYAAAKFDFHINYELDKNEDVRIDYKNDIAVRIFGTNVELLNFEKDEYSLSEIDAILGVDHVTLEGNTHFWHLQDEPDVTMELLDNYAFINAY